MMTPLHRAACALPLLAAAVGCGGGGAKATAVVPDVAPTKARALAAVKAINLTIDDLPLFTTNPPHKARPGETDYDAVFSTCLGVPAGKVGRVAAVEVSFSHDFREVVSHVDVKATLPRAQQDVNAIRKPGAAACLAQTLKGALSDGIGADASVSKPRVTAFTPDAALGAKGAFGFNATATVRLAQGALPVHVTYMGFAVKHTEVSLMVMSVGQPFAAAQRDGLFATLTANATKHAV